MNLKAFYYTMIFSHNTLLHKICPYLDPPRELPLILIGDVHADYREKKISLYSYFLLRQSAKSS